MNFFKLIAVLSHVDINEQEVSFCRETLKTMHNDLQTQERFFDYCKTWKMAAWVNVQLKKHHLTHLLLQQTIKQFEEFHQKIMHENESRNQVARLFLKIFCEKNIDVIILKGNLFAHTVYHDVGYKKMNDFDLLIKQEDWAKVQNIYFDLGFIPMGFGWGGEKQKPTKFSHTAIPFISSDFKCIIGTQWGLKSPTAPYKINIDEAWKTSLPFTFQGLPCKQLSPEYNALHLILHLGIYKCGIRDCMDIYNLFSVNKPDENKLFSLLEQSNAIEKASFTFEISNLCSDRILKNFRLRLNVNPKSFIGRRITKRKKMHVETEDFQLSYNDYFQDIEKNVLYLNIFPLFHQRIYFYAKILRLIFLPDKEHCLKFIDKPHQPTLLNRIKGRIAGPYFAFSMIAQEIGRKVTTLLFIKLFFDVLISPVNYIIPRESYFDYLRKKNIDPEQIKKAVRNVQ